MTSKDAGMAYPSGFTSDGYFLRNPPGWWDRDDTRWEHGHRLVGRTVGVLAIVLAIGCWPCGGMVRVLGVCNLGAIVTQGLLGALRVNEVSTTLAMIHGILGQLCFCLSCSLALVTGRTWQSTPRSRTVREAAFLQRLCLAGSIITFVQLVLGAVLRHFGADTALLLHGFGAIITTFLAGWIAIWIMGRCSGPHLLAWLGRCVALLMVLQLLLGGFTYTFTVMGVPASPFVQWVVPTAHVGVGALLFALLVMVTLNTYYLFEPAARRRQSAAAPAPLTTT